MTHPAQTVAPASAARPARRIRSLSAAGFGALLAAVLVAGCGSDSRSDSGNDSGGGGSATTGTITVSAAASLTGTFNQIKDDFAAAHPGVTINISYGGSDTLAAQINAGAPVDVFAAASDATMAAVVSAGNLAGSPTTFASNTLEIAVPPSNPAKIATLADTAKPGVDLVLCADTVPCGAAAKKVYQTANLTPSPVSFETDVKSVLSKVQLNEADAGLVYKTDVIAAGDTVKGISFPQAAGAATNYPIGVVRNAPNADAAAAFVDYVLSAEGQKALAAAGFTSP